MLYFWYSKTHLNFVTNTHRTMSRPENEDNFEYLAADDPLYAPMQELFNKQLLEKEESLEL